MVRWFVVAAVALSMTACGSSKADPEPVQVRPLLAACVASTDTSAATPAIGDAAALPWPSPDGAQRCATGPAADGDGPLFTNAEQHSLDGAAIATAEFVEGTEVAFNQLAAACFNRDDTCPTGQMAVAVAGRIVSVASVEAPTFSGALQFTFESPTDAETFTDAVNSGR